MVVIGEITTRTFRRFTGRKLLYLETKDDRLFVHPFGPAHDDAIGKIYQLIPGGAGPGDSEHILGYVKSLRPPLPEKEIFPIDVLSEKIIEYDGVVRLQTTIKFDEGSSKIFRGVHRYSNMNGKAVDIELFIEDTKLEEIDKLHAARV